MKLRLTGLAVLLVLSAGVAWATEGEVTAPAADPHVLTAIDGRKVSLDSLVAAGPVVLNFWATWCGPCRLEMPHLQKIYQELGGKGVQFCAVSLDRNVTREALEQFLKKGGVTLPIYRDQAGVLAKAFKVTAIPATMVFAKGGQVEFQTKGYRPGDEILLKKKIEGVIVPPEKPQGADSAGQ